MKTLLLIMTVIISFTGEASDLSCTSEVSKYSVPDKGTIKICKEIENIITFQAMAFGDGHQCGMSGKAKLSGDKYLFKSNDCEVSFIIQKSRLNAKFGTCWRGFCGMKANWYSGEYFNQIF